MSSRRHDAPLGLILLIAGLQVVVGWMVARAYNSSQNSLYNNGNWTVTKTTLDGNIMGAFNYQFNLQALASNRLHLSAWHGYQEVVLAREVDPASVEFDYFIRENGHLTFEFNRADRRFTGIRMSASPRFEPVLLLATVEGRFLRKKAIEELPRRAVPQWQRLRVEFGEEGGFTVFHNDLELRSFRRQAARPQRIGFRGSVAPVFVDNVKIVSRDGATFFDSFDRPANWWRVLLAAVGGLLVASALLYLLLRRLLPIREKYLLFYFLMMTLVLLVVSALWQGVNWHQKKYYPNETERLRQREAAHIETGTEKMIARIENRFSKERPAGFERVLFIGSSQTRGSGAAKPEHTLVRRTERMLNARAGERRFECLNVAVRGYRLSKMLDDFRTRWVDWDPDVVILNAGNNDSGLRNEVYEKLLEGFAETAREAGAKPVLVLEPNSVERGYRGLKRVHGLTRSFGQKNGIPVVEMHQLLADRVDDGFLWWDWVHLTSYGQRVFAEELVDELIRLGVVELPRPSKRLAPPPSSSGAPQ